MKGGKFLDTLTPPTSLPDTVAIGEWLSELVGTLQSQLDMVASGAAMLPYEYLTKRYLNESVPLGATANFQHETNGTLTGRFVKLGPPNDSGFARPVGYRTNSSQLYEVTDRVSESSEALFAGLDLTGPAETGEYGWILTGGVSPISPAMTGAVTHLGEVGWVADDSLATNAATTVGRLISNGADLQVLLNAQPTPINDKTLVASIERLNARLDQVRSELATKPDSNSLNQILQNLVITSITAVNQTVDLIQTQLQRIEGNIAEVEITQTLQAMADFRLELANAAQTQDVARQQMHVRAQSALHSRDSSKVWSDASGVYAEASSEAAARSEVSANGSLLSAEASEGFATSASLSEAAALNYRNLAARFTQQSFPTTFENGFEFYFGNSAAPTPASMAPGIDVTYGPYLVSTNPATWSAVTWKARRANFNGKRWRIRALVSHVSGAAGRIELGWESYNAAEGGVRLAYNTGTAFALSSATPVWIEVDIVAGNYPFITPSVTPNFPEPYTAVQRVYAIELIDMEQLALATSQATAAAGSSASASAAAATALSYMNLAASLGQGFLHANAGFDDYPSATVGQLPTGWANNAYNMGTAYRVADQTNNYAFRTPIGAGVQAWTAFVASGGVPKVRTLGYYELVVDVVVNSGTLAGAGVQLDILNAAGTTTESINMIFASEPDNTGTVPGAGVTGRVYQFCKLIQPTVAGAHGFRIWLNAHFSGYGSVAAAIDLTWLTVGLRPVDATRAQVSTNAGAISTIQGAVAYHETIVAAGGGFPAVVRLKAGSGGSAVDLAASKLTIYNPSNTGQYMEVARFEGGVARLNDAIIRKLQVGPRSDSTIFFPVQLKPKIYVGSDGQTITYETGKTMGAPPERIVPDLTGIPVGAGEALDVRATSVSATQFTVYAKKTTPSAPALQTTAAGTFVGGTPAVRTHKPTADDAYNGYYTFQFDVTLNLNYAELDFGSMYICAYDGNVDFYTDSGSGWVKIGTTYLFFSEYVSGYPGATRTYNDNTFTLSWPNAIGQHGSYEFGIHAGVGSSGVALDNVKYSTQTSGTVTALTQTIPFLVYPPPAD